MRFGRTGITQSTIKVGEPEYLRFDYLRLALIGMALLPPQTGAPRRAMTVEGVIRLVQRKRGQSRSAGVTVCSASLPALSKVRNAV